MKNSYNLKHHFYKNRTLKWEVIKPRISPKGRSPKKEVKEV